MRRLMTAMAVPVLAVLTLIGSALPAEAAQQQNAYVYAHWSAWVPGEVWNIDQNVRIRTKAPYTFWANAWKWSNDSLHGGYAGLQTNGSRFDGSRGDTAIFSIWNANGHRGATCGSFSGEGTGLSCRVAYTIQTDRLYRVRLWRQEADAYGQWWGAWILDQATGIETSLGGLRAPKGSVSAVGFENFTEYWGTSVQVIWEVPRSVADYTQPGLNSLGGGVYQQVGTFTKCTHGTGALSSCTLVDYGWTKAVRVAMGGLG